MTQAFNLSLFANKLNTSGQTDNTGLQNSSVTVTAGTGMSGGGAVALGSSVTLTNAGVTSVTAGTGISVSAATGGVTITNTSPGTSYSAGNGIGISGSSIAVACPTFNSVGSYVWGASNANWNMTSGSNYSAGGGGNQVQSFFLRIASDSGIERNTQNNLSGTWKYMGANGSGTDGNIISIFCRVS
jgi:hypothetical protein